MKNITELRQELVKLYEGCKDESIDRKIVSELNNTAGKMINSARAQLEYSKIRGETPSIPFLH